jgi:hypothetical protein
MNRLSCLIAAIAATLLLNGCLGGALNLGSSAPPPTNIQVFPGDSSFTITWDAAPNVEYWVFAAPGSNTTTDNWLSLGGSSYPKATSPHTVASFPTGRLVNGTLYSFTINGRIDGGPGGQGSPSISVTPRLAGVSWTNGYTFSPNDLNGITYGSVFVAVGNNGALYSSPDFNAWTTATWTTLSSPSYANLYATTYYNGIYLAAGAGGAMIYSTDAVTWTQQTSNTTQDLYAIGINGLGGYAAVGKGGTLITSTDGKTWTSLTPPIANDLHGVAYGNGTWVIVGNAGTLLTSTNGTTWTAPLYLPSTINLKSVVYGTGVDTTTNTATYLFVAVGDNGVLVTSPDGVTWTQSTISSTINPNLKSVTFGRQFVAVGDSGSIFTSQNGTTWTNQTINPNTNAPYTTANLKAVGHSVTIYSTANYSAVGAAGTNLSAI